jgi:hypothetical protein
MGLYQFNVKKHNPVIDDDYDDFRLLLKRLDQHGMVLANVISGVQPRSRFGMWGRFVCES